MSSAAVIPITPSDRVSDVLARDEALVEVFVRHAPHFDKLRNHAMRRVMARLITVEQAARTANVPTARLVHDLNAAIGLSGESSAGALKTPSSSSASASQASHPENATVVELDVREDLRSGREPFSRIMGAVGALRDDEVLHLRAIFEPVPLFTVLGKRGFAHESRAHASDDWSVWFWRETPASGDSPSAAPSHVTRDDVSPEVPADDDRAIYLDVRGLNPPEPMVRTLAALESLPAGCTLVQINRRVPQFLLPVLAERGFAWEIDESRAGRVLVRIWRAE
jgi:uncharacterized protein (DUF2249 family)